MKVIVIREVWQGEDFQKESIDITFKNHAMEIGARNRVIDNTTTFMADEYNLIFLHINNTEARIFFNSLNDEQKNKIILFSTSDAILKTDDYVWCNGYAFMEKMSEWTSFKGLNWHNINERMSLNDIIKALKPKPLSHLIALSILCQGYLAAHGVKESLNGWDEVWKKLSDSLKGKNYQLKAKTKTEKQGWWQPAFEKKDSEKEIKQSDDFSQTIIHDELTSLGKECENSSAIKVLFEEIKSLNDQSFCDTDKVITAYNCIKELL